MYTVNLLSIFSTYNMHILGGVFHSDTELAYYFRHFLEFEDCVYLILCVCYFEIIVLLKNSSEAN